MKIHHIKIDRLHAEEIKKDLDTGRMINLDIDIEYDSLTNKPILKLQYEIFK